MKPLRSFHPARRHRLGAASVAAMLLLSMCAGVHAAPAVAQSTVNALLEQAHVRDGATQAILVTVDAQDGPRARLSTYAYQSGHWSQVMGPVPAVVGKNGTSLHKHEGDMKSPAGIFRMGRAFGSKPEPNGVSLPYTRTTRYDYWVDDASSPDYNRWETWYGDPDQRWKSFERLRIPAYTYAAVIEYNTDPIRKGAGSAIFFHIWPGPDGHTAGCTAVSKQNVLKVLRWLDPARHPVIIQGSAEQLTALAHGKPRS
ncbi:MAG TPA: L,D-transpeptidase family protein [Oleiagrimonas sp.]|nr:L,D-transpeptidase family protein [Oleiagrimonas sp.]